MKIKIASLLRRMAEWIDPSLMHIAWYSHEYEILPIYCEVAVDKRSPYIPAEVYERDALSKLMTECGKYMEKEHLPRMRPGIDVTRYKLTIAKKER